MNDVTPKPNGIRLCPDWAVSKPRLGGIKEAKVQFLLGVFLFVIVVGLVDLSVPWPKARNRGARS